MSPLGEMRLSTAFDSYSEESLPEVDIFYGSDELLNACESADGHFRRVQGLTVDSNGFDEVTISARGSSSMAAAPIACGTSSTMSVAGDQARGHQCLCEQKRSRGGRGLSEYGYPAQYVREMDPCGISFLDPVQDSRSEKVSGSWRIPGIQSVRFQFAVCPFRITTAPTRANWHTGQRVTHQLGFPQPNNRLNTRKSRWHQLSSAYR